MKVLFLVGPHASGKTYSTKKYIDNKDIEMVDTGPIMRKLHNEMCPEISIGEWVSKLESQYGNNISSQLISTEIGKFMNESNCSNFIIIGFRSLKGIMFTVNQLNIDNYNILYVDGSKELLYKNYRLRENNDITFDDFNVYLQEELNSGLGEMRQIAMNDGPIDYFLRCSNNDNFEDVIGNYFNNIKIKKIRKEGDHD